MVDRGKSALQEWLLRYYEINWLRTVNLVLYFVVEILLFLVLTILPIKITFNWLLESYDSVQRSVDIIITLIFLLHVYLYLDHKVKKLVQNPQIKKKLLFQNRVIRLKWLSLLTPQLIYDLVCLGVAVFELVEGENSNFSRALQLIYLAKVYKIKMFHDRFLGYIIGTPFYVIYNVFYGLFILIIIVSYVGCVFYQIDHTLYNENYAFPELLWVVSSAWDNIIGQSFAIQLQYTIYWSLGTASSAAYGNVSASAPDDVVFNILCLYFEGFLFGFYLSRIHSLPEMISQGENELLELFEKFQAHNAEVGRSQRAEPIPRSLYFQILCSLQYQETRKKSLSQVERILPPHYLQEVKTQIFAPLLTLNPLNLWADESLRRSLALQIGQCVTEAGEFVYDYQGISKDDLVFVREGKVQTHLYLDYQLQFGRIYSAGQAFGLFTFVTGLQLDKLVSRCQEYCNLYVLKRASYKSLLSLEQRLHFDTLAHSMISFQEQYALDESIGQYEHALNQGQSNVLFLNPHRQGYYLHRLLDKLVPKFAHGRRSYVRPNVKSRRLLAYELDNRRNVGVQWPEPDEFANSLDQVLILS